MSTLTLENACQPNYPSNLAQYTGILMVLSVSMPRLMTYYDGKDLVSMLDIMEQAAGGAPFLLLMDSNGFEFLMTKEARSLFNTYPKASELIKAEAVIINSTSTKILYNLLTRIHSPKFPFKAFTNETKARKWLGQYA